MTDGEPGADRSKPVGAPFGGEAVVIARPILVGCPAIDGVARFEGFAFALDRSNQLMPAE